MNRTDEYIKYLNELRESGKVNMYGAVPYLQKRFPELMHDPKEARYVLNAWMASFGKDSGDQE